MGCVQDGTESHGRAVWSPPAVTAGRRAHRVKLGVSLLLHGAWEDGEPLGLPWGQSSPERVESPPLQWCQSSLDSSLCLAVVEVTLFLVGDHFIIQRFSLLPDWSLAFSYMFCDFRSIYYKLHCSKAYSPRIQERAGSGVCEGPSREGTESYYMQCTAA